MYIHVYVYGYDHVWHTHRCATVPLTSRCTKYLQSSKTKKIVLQESCDECIFIMDICAIDVYTEIIQIVALVEYSVNMWYCVVVV